MRDYNDRVFRFYIPIIHIIISFVVEFFNYSDISPFHGEMNAIRDSFVSLGMERIMLFLFCKIVGMIMIFIIWRVVYKIIKEKDLLSAAIIVVSGIISFLVYPYYFLTDTDGAMVYYLTVGYNPCYWQTVFVQAIFGACMTVIYHPFSIIFIQLVSFPLFLRYVVRSLKAKGAGLEAYIPIVLLLLPEGYDFFYRPYRNNIYGILMLVLISVIFIYSDRLGKLKKGHIILMIIWIAFMTILRTEGIVNVLVFIAFSLYVVKDRETTKEKAVLISKMAVVYIVMVLILMFPQKAGEYKYFGKDYSMINHANLLQMILTDKDTDYGYDGAQNDLEQINEFYPLKYLSSAGINGFCCANFERSGYSYQSLIDYEDQKKLMEAINRFEKKNLKNVISTKAHWFIATNRGPIGKQYIDVEEYTIPSYEALTEDYYNEFYYGLGVLFETPFTKAMVESPVLNSAIGFVTDGLYGGLIDFCEKNSIIWFLHLFSLVSLVLLESVALIKEERRKVMPVHLISFSILGQWCAMFLGTPTILYAYYYAVFYISALWDFYLVLFLFPDKHLHLRRKNMPKQDVKL